MTQKPAQPEKKQPAPGPVVEKTAPAAGQKPSRKPPINPFTAERGRKLGRVGKSGPSRTAWRAS